MRTPSLSVRHAPVVNTLAGRKLLYQILNWAFVGGKDMVSSEFSDVIYKKILKQGLSIYAFMTQSPQ